MKVPAYHALAVSEASGPTPEATEPLTIFDCDGVLVDSEMLVAAIEAELLGEFGVEITPADVAASFVGLSDADMHRRIEERWSIELPPDFAAEKARRVDRSIGLELNAVPGIASVLESVVGARCVASSSRPERIRASLARTGLAHFFGTHVFSSSMVAHGKPAPDLFLYAAGVMGARPARCVVIEDSPLGVAAGVAAGMTVIGFTAASHCARDLPDLLLATGAGTVATTSEELTGALESWTKGP